MRPRRTAISRAEDRTGRRLDAIALIETAIGVTNVVVGLLAVAPRSLAFGARTSSPTSAAAAEPTAAGL